MKKLDLSELKNKRVVLLFSGGQNSATLVSYINKFAKVKELCTLTVDYNQKNKYELIFSNGFLDNIGIDESKREFIKFHQYERLAGLIPQEKGLYLFLLNLAYNYAIDNNLDTIVLGVSGDFIYKNSSAIIWLNKYIELLNLFYKTDINLSLPLIWFNKSNIWDLAFNNKIKNLKNLISSLSYSCKENELNIYDWGAGCDECSKCKNRRSAYYEALYNEMNK